MPEVTYPPCPTCGTRMQGQAFSAGREAYCPQCRDTFLMTTIGDMRVRFWVCPIGEHRERSDDRGGPIVTVEWRGDIAYCTAPECGRTSADEAAGDLWTGSTEPARECGEHRTTGQRAWCHDCGEWCYPDALCARCELPALRAEIARLRQRVHEVADECQRRHAPYVSRCDRFDTWSAWARQRFEEQGSAYWSMTSAADRMVILSIIEERDAALARVAEYENTITWNTTCHGCADRLDGLVAERAAGYEEGLRDARAQVAEEIAREIETGLPGPLACAWTRNEAPLIAREHAEPVPLPAPSAHHHYISTACWHAVREQDPAKAAELHGYCAGSIRLDGGTKTPARCKHCGATCTCPVCEHEPKELTT